MAIIVGVNSYVTEAEFQIYLDDRGLSVSSSIAILLLKSMDVLESKIYLGDRWTFSQNLEFPRTFYLKNDTPGDTSLRIKKAQMVVAFLLDSGESPLSTIERATKREKVDIIEVEYQDNAATTKYYTEFELLISPYVFNSFGVKRI